MSIIEILQLASQGISPDEIVEMYECYIDGIMQDIEGGINQRSSTW